MSKLLEEILNQAKTNPGFKAKIDEARLSKAAFARNFLRVKDGMDWTPFNPRGFQAEFMDAPEKYIYIWVHRRGGKAQPQSARVLTPLGFRRMGDLSVGDKVLTPSGDSATIKDIHPYGYVPVMTVFMEDGTYTRATEDHLWVVISGGKEWMVDTLALSKLVDSGKEVFIKACSLMKFTSSKINNSLSSSLHYLEEPITPASRDIPNEVIYGSSKLRARYLEKVLTESYFHPTNKYYEYRAPSESFARHVQQLVFGLGGVAHLKTINRQSLMEIYLPVELGLLFSDKFSESWEGSLQKDLRRKVINVEMDEEYATCQCITLDSKDQLYLTDYYITTHNCIDGSSRVIDSFTGRPTPIKDLSKTKKTLVFDFSLNKTLSSPTEWVESGEKHCIKLIFDNGFDITLSRDHQVFSRSHGWIQAGHLQIGDRVLAPGKINTGFKGSSTGGEIDSWVTEMTSTGIIPDPVFKLADEFLMNFVLSVFKKYGKFNDLFRQIEFNVPKASSNDFAHLLLRLGIWSFKGPASEIIIQDPTSTDLFLHQAGLIPLVKDVHSARKWLSIIQVQNVGIKKVYDLTVDHDDHNFIANDIVVHNSFGLAAIALWHLIFDPGRTIQFFCQSDPNRNAFFTDLDTLIEGSPFVQAFVDPYGVQLNSPPIRTFLQGSQILGHIVSANKKQIDTLRGVKQPDIIIIDEAGAIPSEGFSVLNPMYFACPPEHLSRIKGYIAGTVKDPEGEFYNRVCLKNLPPSSRLVKCGIWDNTSLTLEQKNAMFEAEKSDMDRWRTEYVLDIRQTGSTDAFYRPHIDQAFRHDYQYGEHNLDTSCINLITVDFDKVQAGSNVVVWGYNPTTRKIKCLDRYESMKKDVMGFHDAAEHIIDFYQRYKVSHVAVDSSGIDANAEIILRLGLEKGIDLSDVLVRIAMQGKEEVINEETGEVEKKRIKEFAYQLARMKFENDEVILNANDLEMKEQYYKYKILNTSTSTIKFSRKDEHMIDCLFFALYTSWKKIGDFLSDVGLGQTEIGPYETQVITSKDILQVDPYTSSDLYQFEKFLPDF